MNKLFCLSALPLFIPLVFLSAEGDKGVSFRLENMVLSEIPLREREVIAESYIRAAKVKLGTVVWKEDHYRIAKEDAIKEEAIALYSKALTASPNYMKAMIGIIEIMLHSDNLHTIFSPSSVLKKIDFIWNENIQFRDGSKEDGWDIWKLKNPEEAERLIIANEAMLKKYYAIAIFELELFRRLANVSYLYSESEYTPHIMDYTRWASYRHKAIQIVHDLHENYRGTFYEQAGKRDATHLNIHYNLGLKLQ